MALNRRRALLCASLVVCAPWARAGISAAEKARIDRLIQYVESRTDVMFVRNGTAYSSGDAASFLRGKLEQMGSRVTTAQEFIDQIASRSSMSGQPYLIRYAGGHTEPAAKFLGDELDRIGPAK